MKTLCLIVGQKHRTSDEQRALRELPNRSALRLVREPANAFDKNAVQVWTDVADGSAGMLVGYLKADSAKEVAPVLDRRGLADYPAIYSASRSHWAEVDL